MELADVIKGRRSVRRFKSDPVPREVLDHILDLAMWAPSSMNQQQWYFYVVQGEKTEELKRVFSEAFQEMKPRLEKVFSDKPRVVEATRHFFETYGGAPVIILAYAGRGPSGAWDTPSVAVAVQNLLLAIHEAGLGSTWTDGIMSKEEQINRVLDITDKKLVCILPIGYPDEVPKVPPRREGRVQWIGY
ncbi:MAG: nitroreductase family protein [Pseudomonadota bacterium]